MKTPPSFQLTRAFGAATFIAFISYSCSNSQFGSNGIGNTAGSKNKRNDKVEESESLGNSADDDDDVADEPVDVSGAFLTCLSDDSLSATQEDAVGVGCTVFNKDGSRLGLAAIKAKFSVQDASGTDIGALFQNSEAYSVTTQIAKDLRDSLTVVAELESGGKTTILKSQIEQGTAVTLPPPTELDPPGVRTFGRNTDFHIGDGNFNSKNNPDCPEQLQPADVVGKKVVVEFEVKSDEAKVSVMVSEMCGVENDDNEISITGSGFSLPKKDMREGDKSIGLSETTLKKGKYIFQIESDSSFGNYDDFLVGQIIFNHSGEVEFQDPHATQ